MYIKKKKNSDDKFDNIFLEKILIINKSLMKMFRVNNILFFVLMACIISCQTEYKTNHYIFALTKCHAKTSLTPLISISPFGAEIEIP